MAKSRGGPAVVSEGCKQRPVARPCYFTFCKLTIYAMTVNLTFYVLQRTDDAFYWELRGGDDDVLCTSGEAYSDFGDCLAGLYVFRGRAAESPINDRTVEGATDRLDDTEFEVVHDEDGGFDWTFQQATGEPLASGVAHPDKDRLLSGVQRVKEHAGAADVVVEADEPVDIEACSEQGHEPPRARRYRVRIDRQRYIVDRPSITGRELLELAGKTPHTRYRLDQKMRGGEVKRIDYAEAVAVCKPGVERFMTIPLDQNEGGAPPAAPALHRDFDLPEEDVEHLEARGLPWETLRDGGRQWLLLHGWPVPEGYAQREVTLALMIPPSYPVAQFDMAYFKPALVRTDGQPIGATGTRMSIGGESYQRWSRHRTSQNPWRPGLDGVATHLALVEHWLEREFERRPRRA